MSINEEEFNKLPKEEQIVFLKDRAIRCYSKYSHEYEHVRKLLELQLSQLSAVYTLENNIPMESVRIFTRVKSLQSFLKKLESYNWPYFYIPSDVVSDFIGARLICWFQNDCYGILDLIEESEDLKIIKNSFKDYIKDPKPSGYRSLHLTVPVAFERMVRSKKTKGTLGRDKIKCEIQIRTKLQDVFGDLTHEFHYKEGKETSKKILGIEEFLSDSASRLAQEDLTLMKMRDFYQDNKK